MSDTNESVPRPNDKYWASLPAEELGAQVLARWRDYITELDNRGVLDVWARAESLYYGYDPSTNSFADWITAGGEQGEFLNLHVNEFASLIRHQLILTTADKLEFDCVATNDSAQADAQSALGEQVIKFYAYQQNCERLLVQQCEWMLLNGEGAMVQLWDAFAGPEDGVEDVPVYDSEGNPRIEKVQQQVEGVDEMGQPTLVMQEVEQPVTEERVRRKGDFVHRVYHPVDVARDLGCRTRAEARWRIIRERWDKYELAKRYPEHRDYILARPSFERDDTMARDRALTTTFSTHTDQIHALRLLHDKCAELEEGLEAFIVGDKVIGPLMPLAYDGLPIIEMVPQDVRGAPIAHSMNWNLIGPQAAFNALASAGITSSDAGSVPKYVAYKGSEVTVDDVRPNMRMVYVNPNPQLPNGGIPTLLQTPEFRDVHMRGMDAWRGEMQTLSGINAVVRGESEGKSGADNALIQAQAVQYMNAYVRAYQEAAKRWATGIITTMQRFADRERMVEVVGEDETPTLEYFTGENLKDLRQVEVDMGDPVMRSMQGRKAIASELLERFPQQITPEMYITFISSGRLEPLYKAERSQARLIKAENAALARKEPVKALIADDHVNHIREHLSLLSSPALRRDEKLANDVLAHVQQHEMLWMQLSMRPALLAASAQSPSPPSPMGIMGPAANEPPPGAAPDRNAPPPADQAQVSGAQLSNLPQMPKNAANGEPVPAPTAGGMPS